MNKELSQTEESFTQQIDAAETKYEQLAAEIDEKKNEVAVNSDRISLSLIHIFLFKWIHMEK